MNSPPPPQVILLGNSGTGKTSIVDRFAKGRFIKNTRETGERKEIVPLHSK